MGLCTSLALILSYIEALLPPIFTAVPGIKIGLPNIVIIFVLYRFGAKEAISVSLVRVAAVAMIFGSPITFAYSASGAILSLLGMILLKKLQTFSPVGVSVVGSVLHNVGQILAAIVLLGTATLGYYLIVLSITGTIAGIFIGLCGNFAIQKIKPPKC